MQPITQIGHLPPHASAEERLKYILERGKARAITLVEHITNTVIRDFVERGNKLAFDQDADNVVMRIQLKDEGMITLGIHHQALRQVCAEIGMPATWADKLYMLSYDGVPVGKRILVRDLFDLYEYKTDRFVLRTVNGQLLGFVSDMYKRLDSRKLVESFAEVCQEVGAVVCDGKASDTRVYLQAIVPTIREPITGEKVVYGVTFANSDFGHGALNVDFFILRIVNGSGVIGNIGTSKRHKGARVADDIAWSDESKNKDIELMGSRIKDMVRDRLDPTKIEAVHKKIADSMRYDVGDEEGVKAMLKKFLTKQEIEAVMAKYTDQSAIELPQGNTLWRLSSTLAWLAGSSADTDRAAELQEAAGKISGIVL